MSLFEDHFRKCSELFGTLFGIDLIGFPLMMTRSRSSFFFGSFRHEHAVLSTSKAFDTARYCATMSATSSPMLSPLAAAQHPKQSSPGSELDMISPIAAKEAAATGEIMKDQVGHGRSPGSELDMISPIAAKEAAATAEIMKDEEGHGRSPGSELDMISLVNVELKAVKEEGHGRHSSPGSELDMISPRAGVDDCAAIAVVDAWCSPTMLSPTGGSLSVMQLSKLQSAPPPDITNPFADEKELDEEAAVLVSIAHHAAGTLPDHHPPA